MASNATLPSLPTKAQEVDSPATKAASSSLPTNGTKAQEVESPAKKDGPQNVQRRLVTVRRVTSSTYLNSNYDLITIDGWKVVVKRTKGIVEGDWIVFLEADCFVPAHGRFAKFERLFAEIGELSTYDGVEGYRVGMSTWRDHQGKQVVSQGHVFALREFPHIEDKVFELRWERSRTHTDEQFLNYLRTLDFRNGLDVMKWESPDDNNDNTQQQQLTVTTFPKYPHFILKPDMERVQNCPNLFLKPKYRTYLFQESVKLDGASMTVYFLLPTNPSYSHLPTLPALSPASILTHPLLQHAVQQLGRFGVCSRKHDLVPHLISQATTPAQHIYWAAALAAKLHVSLPAGAAAGEHGSGSIAVQGELVGAGIRGNPYGYAKGEHEFVIYAVYDVDRRKRWDPRKVVEFAERIGVRHVPVRGYHRIWDVARNHEDLVVRAELRNAEGLVWKNVLDGRWFKVLSSRWVLEK
ncbi:DNA ligase/mRNA capping enzyme, partial [Canariomyces notabilis]